MSSITRHDVILRHDFLWQPNPVTSSHELVLWAQKKNTGNGTSFFLSLSFCVGEKSTLVHTQFYLSWYIPRYLKRFCTHVFYLLYFPFIWLQKYEPGNLNSCVYWFFFPFHHCMNILSHIALYIWTLIAIFYKAVHFHSKTFRLCLLHTGQSLCIRA